MNITTEQLLGFRADRLGLTADLPDLASAARSQLGGQAQIEGPAVMGLSQRVAGRPAAEVVKAALTNHELVRAWGQRDTVHVYSPEQWPWVVAARAQWGRSARKDDPHANSLADAAAAHLAGFDRPVTRGDFLDLIDQSWLDQVPEYFDTHDKRWRYATGRLIWLLGNRGLLAHGPKVGSEQQYIPRHVGWPDLDFGNAQRPAIEAAAILARLYLGSYGPATVQDMAHFFGAKVSSARGWVATMSGLTEVTLGERTLLARQEDLDDLAGSRVAGLRLIPGYDNVLMGHADKSNLVPHEADRAQIWKKAAVVKPIVWHDGRAVATWSHKVMAKSVRIRVTPLSGWTSPDLSAAVQEIAAHFGKATADVRID